MTPFATAGDERTTPPLLVDHSTAPVVALSAYTLSSSEPTYTTPFPTAGDERTAPPGLPARPVPVAHSTAPVVALSAYTLSSSEPTYTTPFATAGDERTAAPVPEAHFCPSPPTLVVLRTCSLVFHPSW